MNMPTCMYSWIYRKITYHTIMDKFYIRLRKSFIINYIQNKTEENAYWSCTLRSTLQQKNRSRLTAYHRHQLPHCRCPYLLNKTNVLFCSYCVQLETKQYLSYKSYWTWAIRNLNNEPRTGDTHSLVVTVLCVYIPFD